MDFVEDKDLVKEFLNGNEIAFKKLVNKYSKKIYWHARGMLNNHFDADEITQEVIIVLYNKLNTFNFESNLYTWIYRITSTRTLNLIRKKKVKEFFSLSNGEFDSLKSEGDLQNNYENKAEIEKIENVLQKIPVRQREVFIMKNFEELSYKEISEITGKSIGGLKANYFHALKKITELLNGPE
ncbi:MAG: RNA polymerase sigma factor [Bacteroidetes bacterium]|nr:RNA polymerase sigma factor [Bacteroidota bacterium]MBU1115409.1 RNA polymerase sigma factor [Bacteroidota bacterium]MBU1797930.1 RNA polymerase sigma factor [Bacteroidota bacterium]